MREIPELPEPVEGEPKIDTVCYVNPSAPSTPNPSENVKLVRQIQSLVNKFASNLVPICNEF